MSTPHVMLIIVLLPLFVGMARCSTQKAATSSSAKPASTEEGVGEVINQPLADLNISNGEIPPLLV